MLYLKSSERTSRSKWKCREEMHTVGVLFFGQQIFLIV